MSDARTIESVRLEDIKSGQTSRLINKSLVEVLVESFQVIGQLHPISLRRTATGALELVAGRHRLEAMKALGRETIPADFMDADTDRMALWEIDENLQRAELTQAERAMALARRKDIYERLHPETRAGMAGGLARQGTATDKLAFADSAASILGVAPRTIQRDIHRATSIAPDVMEKIAGTEHDKGTVLDRLARMSDEQQRQWCSRPSTPPEPEVLVGRARKRLEDAWERAPENTRRAFLGDKLAEHSDLAVPSFSAPRRPVVRDAEFEDVSS